MAGKRVKRNKKRGPKLLGAVVILTIAGVMLFAGQPQGVAVNSPLEQPAPEELLPEDETLVPEEPDAAQEETEPSQTEPLAENPPVETQQETPERPVMPEEPVETTPEEPPADPVEDTYFDDAVFLGDSRTEGFHLYSGLSTGKYLYVTGATVASVFNKSVDTPLGKMPLLDALQQMDCGKIYVMLGINELGWNGTDIFRNQSAKLIERLQADHPDATIVIQSILPVSAKQDAKGSYVNNQRIDAYNQVLQELAETYGVVYLNVAEAVMDEDGYLRADWNFDGVHLNKAGCQAWLDYLRTHPVTES